MAAKNDFFRKVKIFSRNKETPYLVLSLKEIEKNYDALRRQMPFARIYYAVKANPHEAVLSLLKKKGANFDVASRYELNALLKIGVAAERISFGNTIKKQEDIAFFYDKGVRLFATDSNSDLKKIARHAPGSNVFLRLYVDNTGSDWGLSRKFGAHPDLIISLASEAKALGLKPYGLSFHVGSQQRDVEQWDQALSQCKHLFEVLKKEGIELQMINLGGGLPSPYLNPTPDLKYYCRKIKLYLQTHFQTKLPQIIIEPGRFLVGSGGIIVATVVLITKKADSLPYKWLYIDAGIYQGLDECVGEAIQYSINTERSSRHKSEFVIAGPTCDSHDILYEKNKYKLPATLKEGSKLFFLTAGAYTYQVSSIGFNGFPPLRVYILEQT